MSKIPTAEEFATEANEFRMPKGVSYQKDIGELMIEFAKLHVKAALEAANENAELKDYDEYQYGGGYITKQEIDKDSILKAYPDENIK